MVSEPKEELHIDRTYFKITNPEEEALKQELAKQQLEAFKKLLERLKEINSKNPAQELIQKLIEERLRQELEKAMREQAMKDAMDSQDGENGDSQNGEGQDGQEGEGQDGNPQPGGQGGNPTSGEGMSGDPMIQDGEGMGDGKESMGFTLSDDPADPNAPTISISIPRDMYNIEEEPKDSDENTSQDGDEGEEGEGGSGDSTGTSEETKLSEKDFTKGGSTHGAKELEEQEAKKISVSKKTRFK